MCGQYEVGKMAKEWPRKVKNRLRNMTLNETVFRPNWRGKSTAPSPVPPRFIPRVSPGGPGYEVDISRAQ